MKGRKKGLERKTAPDPSRSNEVLKAWELLYWARCGPDLDPSVLAYHLLTDSPYAREEIRGIFAERAAKAFETLDYAFFTRVAASISRVKAYNGGEMFDPTLGIIVGSYVERRRQLFHLALDGREPAAFDKEDAMLEKGDFEEYSKFRREVFDQTGARNLPTMFEIIQECEKDPKWPKKGDQKKYTYDLLKKFELPYHRARPGRPKESGIRK